MSETNSTKTLNEPSQPPLMTNARTTDRTLVHRRSLSEVFLTDMHQIDGRTYFSAAQLPRRHPYYGDHVAQPAQYDPLLLLEVCRQTAMAGSHLYYGVPFDHDFILTDESISISRPDDLIIGPEPCDLLLRTVITDVREREGAVTGLGFALAVLHDEDEIAHARFGIRYRPRESYREMRMRARAKAGLTGLPSSADMPASQPGAAVRPGHVGRSRDENVVLVNALAEEGRAYAEMRVPIDHPSMFDHPLDHIPGHALAEAARQLAVYTAQEALAMSATTIDEISAVFTQFGELDQPVRLSAVTEAGTVAPRVPVTVTVSQGDDPICYVSCTVTELCQ